MKPNRLYGARKECQKYLDLFPRLFHNGENSREYQEEHFMKLSNVLLKEEKNLELCHRYLGKTFM